MMHIATYSCILSCGFALADNAQLPEAKRSRQSLIRKTLDDALQAARDIPDPKWTNLYNERHTWLDLAHKKLDAAVAASYGWPAELGDEEILARLLKLNLERAKVV